MPVPETSACSGRPCHITRGTGTTFVHIPGISVSYVRPPYCIRNFCELCTTSILVPGNPVSAGHPWHITRGKAMPCSNTRVRIPVWVQHSCAFAERLWVLLDFRTRTRSFVKLCKTSIPVTVKNKPYHIFSCHAHSPSARTQFHI